MKKLDKDRIYNLIGCYIGGVALILICSICFYACSKEEEVKAQNENNEFDIKWEYQDRGINIGVIKDKSTGVEYIYTIIQDDLHNITNTNLTPRLSNDAELPYTGQ